MKKNDIIFIQDQIGYCFKNTDLLHQAFVRRSYSVENGGENNEVLEFIGDKVLDFITVKILTEKYSSFSGNSESSKTNALTCQYNEAELTELKKKLVQKSTLAQRINALGLGSYLIMGKGDLQNHIQTQPSVKEDLFEAIIGAVALDSDWSIKELQSVVEVMLDPDSILTEDISENYVELIQKWTINKYETVPLYHFDKYSLYTFSDIPGFPNLPINMPTHWNFVCLLKLGEFKQLFKGYGISKTEARKNACIFAYNYIKEQGLLSTIQDEIKFPNRADSISQLEILARKGYFSIPKYKFVQEYDKNGNPIWKCSCHIPEITQKFYSQSSTKKDAKKDAAYEMLTFVLNNK